MARNPRTLLLSGDGKPVRFERVPLNSHDYNEAWLQEILFDNPTLLRTDENQYPIVPICRELRLPREGGHDVSLDIFCLRTDGRPVLVECKLWRNPQSRREVIGQILEYASILQGFQYADLQALLKPRLGMSSKNPIFDHVSHQHSDIDEADFVDACHGYLESGQFEMIIAGDGIRSGLGPVKELLGRHGGIGQNLKLLELYVLQSESGDRLVHTQQQFEATCVETVGNRLQPVGIDSLPHEREPHSAWRDQCTQFWNKFLAQLELDHPEQETPRRQGSYNVLTPMPSPMTHLSCFRVKSSHTIGVFLMFESTPEGNQFFDQLLADQDQLSVELEAQVYFESKSSWTDRRSITVKTDEFDIEDEGTTDQQIEYLSQQLNRMVNTFRRHIQ